MESTQAYLPQPADAEPWAASTLLTQGEWYVLHTRSRQEKALAADLDAMGVGYFLPLIRMARTYGSHKVTVELPMFPSYLFLRGTIEQAYMADRTRRLARLIPVSNQKQMDWELRNIRLALTRKVAVNPFPRLVKGVRVEVKSGPLRGLQGTVEDRVRPDRLILQVDMLGQGVTLEVDGAVLEPLN